MTLDAPATELDARFSSAGATPTEWSRGRDRLATAEVYWLSTVRTDGRPHVTPLLAVWADDALHFCTGPGEQKAKNLAGNPYVVLTAGSSAYGEGLDIVVEGEAVRLTDDATLRDLADRWVTKYGEDWRFGVGDGCFVNPGGGDAYVFRVAPRTAFGFGKGEPFSQTRWRF